MVSALASQLQQFAQIKTQSFIKPSFLFDGRKAADLDVDAIYAIANGGLQELETIDQRFVPFEDTILSRATKDKFRELQTSEQNEDTDQQITALLRLLSPYFLLKSAQKVLEYLIRKFKVNELNVDAVLECCIPYHETNAFVRLVQILRISGSKWRFLEPIQKANDVVFPVPRSLFVECATKDPAIFLFVCEATAASVRSSLSNKTLLSFYAAFMIEYLLKLSRIQEDTVLRVLPYILEGLRSSDLDYQRASIMISAQLCRLAALTRPVVHSLLVAVSHAATSSPDLAKDAVAALLVVFDTQTVGDLDAPLIEVLLGIPTFVECVSDLSAQVDATKFLTPLLPALAASCVRHGALLRDLLDRVPDVSLLVPLVVPPLLTAYANTPNEHPDRQAIKKESRKLLETLCRRFPEHLERAIDTFLKAHSESSGARNAVGKLLSRALAGTRLETLPEVGTPLFLALEHPDRNIRLLALDHLDKFLESPPNLSHEDRQGLQAALLRRIVDEDPRVAKKALQAPALMTLVDPNALFDAASAALDVSADDPSRERALLKALCAAGAAHASPEVLDGVVHVLLRFLLSSDRVQVSKVHATALRLAADVDHPALAGLDALATDSPTRLDANKAIVAALSANLAAHTARVLPIYLTAARTCAPRRSPAPLALTVLLAALDHLHQPAEVLQLCGPSARVAFDVLSAAPRKPSRSARRKRIKAKLERDSHRPEPDSKHDEQPPVDLAESWTSVLQRYPSRSATESQTVLARSLLAAIETKLPQWHPAATDHPTAATDGTHGSGETGRSLVEECFVFAANEPDLDVAMALLRPLLSNKLGDNALPFLQAFLSCPPSDVPPRVQLRSLHLARTLLLPGPHRQPHLPSAVALAPHALVALASPLAVVRHAAVALLPVLRDALRDQPDGPSAASPAPPSSRKKPAKDRSGAPRRPDAATPASSAATTSSMVAFLTALDSRRDELLADASTLPSLTAAMFAAPDPRAPATSLLPLPSESKQQLAAHLLRSSLSASTRLSLYGQALCLRLPSVSPTPTTLLATLSAFIYLQAASRADRPLSLDEVALLRDALAYCTGDTADTLSTDPQLWSAFLDLLHRSPLPVLERLREDPSIFAHLGPDPQRNVISACLALLCASDPASASADVVRAVHAALRVLLVPAAVFADALLDGLAASSPATATQQGVATRVLEILQYKLLPAPDLVPISDPHHLAPPLFAILKSLQPTRQDGADMHMDDAGVSTSAAVSGAEYEVQLALGSLDALMRSCDADSVREDLDVDALLSTVTRTVDPSTRTLAMVALATAATIAPEQVLHHIVPLVTVVTPASLSTSDNFTFTALLESVDKMVGAMVRSGHRVDSLVRVLVASVPDMLPHRRLPLLLALLRAVGLASHLPRASIHLLARPGSSSETESDAYSPSELCVALFLELRGEGALDALPTLVGLLCDAVSSADTASTPKPAKKKTRPAKVAAGAAADLPPELQRAKVRVAVLTLLRTVLGKLPPDAEDGGPHEATADPLQRTTEALLRLLHVLAPHDDHDHDRPAATKTDAHRSESVQLAYEALDAINAHLSVPAAMRTISALLSSPDAAVVARAVDLLAQRLSSASSEASSKFAAHGEQLVSLLPRLADVYQALDVAHAPSATTAQSILIAAHHVARLAAPTHPDAVMASMVPRLVLPALASPCPPIVGGGALLLSVLVRTVTVRMLPHLPTTMPALMRVLESCHSDQQPLVAVSVLACLDVVVSELPQFLTPYLQPILHNLLHPSLLPSPHPQVSAAADRAVSSLCTRVAPRLLAPAISAAFDALASSPVSLGKLMDVAGRMWAAVDRAAAHALHKTSFTFFLRALDHVSTLVDGRELLDHVRDALVALVMKLSETEFRPLFVRLVEWSSLTPTTTITPPSSAASASADLGKVWVLSRVLLALVKRLKSIFVPYMSYIWTQVASLLSGALPLTSPDHPHGVPAPDPSTTHLKKKKKRRGEEKQPAEAGAAQGPTRLEVVVALVDTLHLCFIHDQNATFLADANRFDEISVPLVDLLEDADVRAGAEALTYAQFIQTHLTAGIANLAATIADDASWKPLNHKILMKTRHDDAPVRLAALRVFHGMVNKIGEEWLVLLPESISFLAELMEDEDDAVQKATQDLIAMLERLSGESLQKYLS